MSKEPLNVELYGLIGSGRPSQSYQPTVVYKGRMKKTIEFVAAKSIDNQRKDEVYNYAEVIESITHPNIVKFYHWYQTDHHFWTILEYCPGGTLLELLEQDGRLPEPIIRIFASDILAGLLYLHQNGVLFRDLQPRNILLDECGNLKLNDFSHAERLDKPFDFGLPDPDLIEYMAPELFNEGAVASFASDHWALGCLMYRMAAGSTPFSASSQTETVNKILNFQPPTLSGYSNDFNDLVQKLLNKDCFERIKWIQIIAHPFWKEALKTRLDHTFDNFEMSSLPSEPRIESNRFSVGLEKRKSTIALPSHCKKDEKNGKDQREMSISNLILSTPLLKPTNLIFNQTIEVISIPEFDPSSLPVTQSELISLDPQERQTAISTILQQFKATKIRPKKKFPLISFLIQHSKTPSVATNLANSQLFVELLELAKDTKHLSLSSGYLLLYSSIVRSAIDIPPVNLSESSLANLQSLVNESERVSRKAIICLGEVAYYIASAQSPLAFPPYTNPILLNSLKSTDEPTRHYALRAISNLLTKPKYSEIFDLNKVEAAVIEFDVGDSPLLLDSYATCLVTIYEKKQTSYKDRIIKLIQTLLSKTSTTTRTIGILLATVINALPQFQQDLFRFISDSIGELKTKALLALCLILENDVDSFVPIAQKFYAALDKIEKDSPEAAVAVAKWTAVIASGIIETISKTNKFELCQIIYQAIQFKICRNEVWTKKFETNIRNILNNVNFDLNGCEYLLQLIESAISCKIADPMIVTDLVKAFESSKNDIRFTALKLVADAASTPQIPQELVSFITKTIFPILTTLLKDEGMIADLPLRILSYVASADRSVISQFADKDRLPLIFARVPDNASALTLACLIVQNTNNTIDDFVKAGLVDAILEAMDKPNSVAVIDLLHGIMYPVSKMLSENPNSPQINSIIPLISRFATLAPKLALMIPESSKAAQCLGLMVHIYTPQNSKEKILYTDCLEPFGASLLSSGSNPEYAKTFSIVLNLLNWAALLNQTALAAIKQSPTFMKAIKKCSDSSPDEVQKFCTSILQATEK